ncbi:hypothetical protein E2C01_015838 [Portunus trituberculatus]|uniref:Uncharacterized protein n=1 Tax=Portunus trituberculatus TaxID=210409 RepID=A0A5B7DMW9_PORTR|nr:hypothetical protein [Portunus trituberculatus]
MVQWNHMCFGGRGISKHTGSNLGRWPSVGQMNRDPWSVTDLYLEEIAIEVIVQDKQEASHHSDQAAKCDMQLQDLFSLFGKEQTESKVSNLSTSEPTLALSSNINSEMLEKDNKTCDQHLAGSVTSAACTQVSRVPLPTNMALVPITSVPKSLLHETSVTGSSGDLNVRGKKLELTSKSIKCVSELEIDTSKKLNDQKQDFALECAATSSSGNGTDLENFSDVEQETVTPSEEAQPTLGPWTGFEPMRLETPQTPQHAWLHCTTAAPKATCSSAVLRVLLLCLCLSVTGIVVRSKWGECPGGIFLLGWHKREC